MIILFAMIWFGCLFVLLVTRFSNLSILILSSLLYSAPIFWAPSSTNEPIYVWIMVLFLTGISQFVVSDRSNETVTNSANISKKTLFINSFFNISLFLALLIIVLLSDGIDAFFEGKYGEKAGGNMLIYYAWNSILLITSAQNIHIRKLVHPYNIFCYFQIFLIFVGGDRTIPILYMVVMLRHFLANSTPISLFTLKRASIGLFLLVSIPIVSVSKTIYTMLPQYGFSFDLINSIFNSNLPELVAKDFEPNHTYQILVYAVNGDVNYYVSDMFRGLLSVIPGSSFLGVDPHMFSSAVKVQYFPDWSDSAGIGSNFWAQAFVLGDLLGVLIFCLCSIFFLVFIERKMSLYKNSARYSYLIVLASIFGFYIQRNSFEQLLSFFGRYSVLFIFIYILSIVVFQMIKMQRKIIA